MNEIAKMHNDLIDLPLRKLNSSEIDILTALCYKCQGNECKNIVLDFNKIKELSHFKSKNETEFIETLKNTNKKLLELNFTIKNEEEIKQFVLFPTFTINIHNETLTVQVHEIFSYLLNNLTENYTSLELQESTSLKSSYSKGIYKKLRKYRNTDKPFWKVNMKEFREYLDIPKSYKQSDLDKRVLHPALEELKPYFEGLTIEKYSNKKKGQRGRPKVDGLIFTFKGVEKAPKEPFKATQEGIANYLEDWSATGMYCPKCKREIFKKKMENENGMYYLYGHTDFKTGECNYSTNDYSNLLQEYQIRENENTLTEEEREENKGKISKLLGGLFK